ncbi:MAG: glycosyltransferase family 2 protein [Erythrobacter sp.]|uniref:glycosyltransferase family 2 protein n=1 Tax=Erythrobacter sp. TaxID=1042 RepID=UPI00260C3A10|nr:glycosyltransferase family 2 protein [Erythrobacter sp.]MDJ0979370.1 glycosyltransferase family 2 protein [Erythrobacter sp.]
MARAALSIGDHQSDDASSSPIVSVMIVAYNSAGFIERCIGSIGPACQNHAYEVLLIDNGDGSTANLVKGFYPSVKVVPSKGNVGFASGNNLIAANARGRYLLLLNPDFELRPHALDSLIKATTEYPEASGWGGVTLGRDGKPDMGNTVHIPSLSEMLSRTFGNSKAQARDPAVFDKDSRVDVLSGSFAMFSRAAWEEAGGLDERYFLYCEEVDLFYRLGRAGHSFWRIAQARGYHDIGHGRAFSPSRMLYRAAGTMQFARIHWSMPRRCLAFVLIWLGAAIRFIVGILLGRTSPRLKVVGESHRILVTRPGLWRHGYDPKKGLMARLEGGEAS